MSYSVLYDTPYRSGNRLCERRPYADFLHRGSLPAIFKFAQHVCDNVIYAHFAPDDRIIHVEFDYEYYTAELLAEIEIDREKKRVSVVRLLFTSENLWPEIFFDTVPKIANKWGGVSWYKRHVCCFGADFDIETYVHTFFGNDWIMGPLPATIAKPTEDQIVSSKTYEARLGNYLCGPWGRTVGTFFVDRSLAATVIQKHFRGWRVRMETTFNPNSPFGFACLKRRFLGFSVEDVRES